MRFDLVFSYWIFAWYLLYEMGVVLYNPAIALIIGLLENAVLLCAMIYWKNSIRHILEFIIINTFIKVIPLWTLRHTRMDWYTGLVSTIVLFGIYVCWLIFNGVRIGNVGRAYRNIQQDKPAGPFMEILDRIL